MEEDKEDELKQSKKDEDIFYLQKEILDLKDELDKNKDVMMLMINMQIFSMIYSIKELLIQKEILLKMIKIDEINKDFLRYIEFVVTFLSKTLNFRFDFNSDYLWKPLSSCLFIYFDNTTTSLGVRWKSFNNPPIFFSNLLKMPVAFVLNTKHP